MPGNVKALDHFRISMTMHCLFIFDLRLSKVTAWRWWRMTDLLKLMRMTSTEVDENDRSTKVDENDRSTEVDENDISTEVDENDNYC